MLRRNICSVPTNLQTGKIRINMLKCWITNRNYLSTPHVPFMLQSLMDLHHLQGGP